MKSHLPKWSAALAGGLILIALLWQPARLALAPTPPPATRTSTLSPTAAITPSPQPSATPQLPTATPQPSATPPRSLTPPSPGPRCGEKTAEALLPNFTTTPATAAPRPTGTPPTPGITDPLQLSQRAGFGMSSIAIPEIWANQLRSGWYISWTVQLRSVGQIPEHWQTVRLQPGCYYPSKAYIQWVAAQYPGLVWIIGNEPDVIWQDNLSPEEYARVYHELYTAIKTADPSARLAVGAIAQATPLRLEYLDRVLKTYREAYSTQLPVDWWTIHGYVLREERKSWGVEIPPGLSQAQGELREVSDHDRLDLFKQQIRDFRRWMLANGYRDLPLALTEFGILMPEEYGFPPAVVAQYLRESFAWLQSASDSATGQPADDNRLVQRWAWFSLADSLYPAPDLANLDAETLTALGSAFREYVLKNKP